MAPGYDWTELSVHRFSKCSGDCFSVVFIIRVYGSLFSTKRRVSSWLKMYLVSSLFFWLPYFDYWEKISPVDETHRENVRQRNARLGVSVCPLNVEGIIWRRNSLRRSACGWNVINEKVWRRDICGISAEGNFMPWKACLKKINNIEQETFSEG